MQRDGAVLRRVLRIFLRVIEQSLQSLSPSAAQVAQGKWGSSAYRRAPPDPVAPKRSPAHCLWVVLIARIKRLARKGLTHQCQSFTVYCACLCLRQLLQKTGQ